MAKGWALVGDFWIRARFDEDPGDEDDSDETRFRRWQAWANLPGLVQYDTLRLRQRFEMEMMARMDLLPRLSG